MARIVADRPHAGKPSWAFAPALIGSQLRRFRSERELFLVVFGVVLVTTFVFAALPRMFNELADDGLAHAVTNASSIQRNLQFSRADVIPDGFTSVFSQVEEEGNDIREGLAPSIQEIIGRQTYVIDTPRHNFVDLPGEVPFPSPRYLTLRYQSEVEPHIRFTEGRMPQAVQELVEVPGAPEGTIARVYETAISTETARQLQLGLGDEIFLFPNREDALVRFVPASEQPWMMVRFVGIFELNDSRDDFWVGVPQIDRAVEYDDGIRVHFYATGLFAANAYPQLLASPQVLPMRYSWRFFVNSDTFDAGSFDTLAADIRRLEAEYPTAGSDPFAESVRTGLSRILSTYLSQRNLAVTVLSLTAAGLLAVACAVIALVAALITERRRQSLVLLRGRGGAPSHIVGPQVAEGLLWSVPAALIGWLGASLLIGERASVWSVVAAIGIALLTTLLIVAGISPVARRSLGALERGNDVVRGVAGRRVVLDLFIVALAGIGVYLLRRRGLAGDSATEQLNEFDPYLAAVPVLLGLATGLIVLRLYPLPIKLFAWIAALRRDLVPALGFRRVARQPGTSNLPLLVLLLSVAVAVFGSIITSTIADGQVDSSWQRAGADFRVMSGPAIALNQRVNLNDISGVDAVAGAYIEQEATAGRTASAGRAQLMAVETLELTEVNAGTIAEPMIPADMLEPRTGAEIGRPTNPIPAVVSPRVGGGSMAPGDTFSMTLFSRETTFLVREVRDSFPGLDVTRDFVVIPLADLQAAFPDRPIRLTDLFVRADESAASLLETTLEQQSPSATIVSREALYNDVHDAPLIAGVSTGFRVGLLVTAFYAALAVVVALILTGQDRARDLAYLRTLGLSQRQALGLTIIEQAPPALIAVAAGLGLGVAVARLIEPGLDLTAFTGPGVPVTLTVDWAAIALLGVLLLAIVGGAIGLTTRLSRRVGLGQVLRLGDG